METFSALLAICAGNSPVPGEFPAKRPVPRSFDVFFDLRLNKRLNKQSSGWWFETLSRPFWRHRNAKKMRPKFLPPHHKYSVCNVYSLFCSNFSKEILIMGIHMFFIRLFARYIFHKPCCIRVRHNGVPEWSGEAVLCSVIIQGALHAITSWCWIHPTGSGFVVRGLNCLV